MKSQSKARIGAQSAQQLHAMPFHRRNTFAATKEDLEQNTVDIPVVKQRQVLVIQKAPRTANVPLHQYSDTTVDVPVAKDAEKTPQKQHEDCITKYNEIKMDKKLRSAQLRTENKKQTVFDSEGTSDLRLTIRYQKGSRVTRWVTLTTPAKTVVRRQTSRQNESTNRSSMCMVPLSILEETVAVMKLVPHEHSQTGPEGLADAEDS